MKAYRIILSHFSQRYPKIPVFDTTYEDRICIASDFMTINFKDLQTLPSLLPSLRCLFKELEEIEQAREEAKEEKEEKKREAKEKKMSEFLKKGQKKLKSSDNQNASNK
jgi:hypothetical protein